jgi:eukaryotic-like serine/threonine-protein kinase
MLELVGQQLGGYELLKWLGEGAHVNAYLAREESTNQLVVIKILKSQLAETGEFLDRFHMEAQAALELNHPNLVKVIAYNQQDDILYLVEEVMEKGSLLDIFNQNPGQPLPLDVVTRTVEQIGAVLDYAHGQGIIHRDVKPENILFDANGNAHLSDLGITKTMNPEAARTRSDLEFGNPNYMSPEAWQGKPADARTDIYALGIIVYEMLTGQLPFNSTMSMGLAYVHLMHLMARPTALTKLRPDLSPKLESVVEKAIEKDPNKRYQSAGEFAAQFKSAL